MDGNRAGSGEGYASVDGVGQNLGYFHVWLTKSGEVGGASAADGGGRSCAAARLRRRRLLVAGAAASLAGMACASLMSVSPGGAAARLPGGWGRAVELQGLGSASPGPSNQGGLKVLQKEHQERGTRAELLVRQPRHKAVSKEGTLTKQELVFNDGCGGSRASLVRVGNAFACGGPDHEDHGLMTHENHCMMFSKHEWEFQGVGSLFQGGSNGDNGDYGTLMDPGTDYCIECLDSPWDGMVGLEVCNSTDPGQLWTKQIHTNGVAGFMTEGDHHVTTYSNHRNGMMLDHGCNGKCFDTQVCLPTHQYRMNVNDVDFISKEEREIEKGLPEDPIAPIR